MSTRILVVGGGVGGLSAAAVLAGSGHDVTVVERAGEVGGKLRVERVEGRDVDAGPTVLTMRWALERVFEAAGARMDRHLDLEPLHLLARHHWLDGACLDLFDDVERTAAGVEVMSGAANADGYLAFAAYARRIWDVVREPFIESPRPTVGNMLALIARGGVRSFAAIDSTRTMWSALRRFFPDVRLSQLFGRYATYCGSSPFTAPATLNCVAHVEREGVWSVRGGMARIGAALAAVARGAGATVRTNAHVEEIVVRGGAVSAVRLAGGETIAADCVVFNGDVAALRQGLLGEAAARASGWGGRPSLSAVTIAAVGALRGVEAAHHNVFFSPDCRAEFDAIAGGRVPALPTVYLCAQDRSGAAQVPRAPERLFLIVNAPPVSGGPARPTVERLECERNILKWLSRFGVSLELVGEPTTTLPAHFAQRFPGTRGAIYGRATTGVWSSFTRPASRTSIRGLYLAGGSAHPGSGVPMAATSGRLAAACLSEDLRSTARWGPTAMRGGTWTRPATTAATRSS